MTAHLEHHSHRGRSIIKIVGAMCLVFLLVGCGSEVHKRYTLHQEAHVLPGRSDTNDLAIAFRLDEFAERDTVVASAAALREGNIE